MPPDMLHYIQVFRDIYLPLGSNLKYVVVVVLASMLEEKGYAGRGEIRLLVELPGHRRDRKLTGRDSSARKGEACPTAVSNEQ